MGGREGEGLRVPRSAIRAGFATAVIALLATLLACLSAEAHAKVGPRVSGSGYDGVLLDLPSPRKDVQVWVPSESQIAELESRLPGYVKQYLKTHKAVLPRPLSRYKRQYVGVRERERRLIGISFYGDGLRFVTSGRWLKRVGDTSPGGGEYLGAVYDADAGKFVLFEIISKPERAVSGRDRGVK